MTLKPCTMRCGNLARGPICEACRHTLESEAIGAYAPRDKALAELQYAVAFITTARREVADSVPRKILARALRSIQEAKDALERGHKTRPQG